MDFFEPLHFHSPEPFNIRIPYKDELEYSFDKEKWLPNTNRVIDCPPSGIYIRNTSGSQGRVDGHFELQGESVSCDGSVMSLIGIRKMSEYAFTGLFSCCRCLVKAPLLPATELADACYSGMFQDCTSLKEAPALPALKLTTACYSDMFSRCHSLVKAPALPAAELAESCYSGMFLSCGSLVEAPALPATKLAVGCYKRMFACSSLIKAPALPAAELAESCYAHMFASCHSLIEGPALSATKLAVGCYKRMFYDCIRLVKAPALPATKLVNACYQEMFASCHSLIEGPTLPATNLVVYGYRMFYDCPHLGEASALPANASDVDFFEPLHFHSPEPFRIRIPTVAKLQYSFDKKEWIPNEGESIKCPPGGIYVRGKSGCWMPRDLCEKPKKGTFFVLKGKSVSCDGSVMSLLGTYEMPKSAFQHLFYDCKILVKAPTLPATELAEYCYLSMFEGCELIIKAPILPATRLVNGCYVRMFCGCTSLIEEPALPTDKLTDPNCKNMFYGCTSLVKSSTSSPIPEWYDILCNIYSNTFGKMWSVDIDTTRRIAEIPDDATVAYIMKNLPRILQAMLTYTGLQA